MFHTPLILRLSFVLITLQVTLTFTCGKEFLLFQQLLHNHDARLLQLCKVVNTLHKLPQPCHNLVTTLSQPCHNLVTTLSQPYKVAARLLQPSYFRMGKYVYVFCCYTVNGERCTGLNFHVFHGFPEYHEGFSVNISASLYL